MNNGYSDAVVNKLWTGLELVGDCWEWTGFRSERGYGKLHITGMKQTVYAHRLAYEIANDRSIEPGLVIDHLCRNTSCANPLHLEEVTQLENILRGRCREVKYAIRNTITHCKSGHEFTPANTRYWGKKRYRACLTCARRNDRAMKLRRKAKKEERIAS